MTRKHVLGVLVAVLLAAAAARAETKVVYLKGGRQFTGEVTRTADGSYEIRTGMGTVIVAGDEVLRVEDAVTPKEELKNRLDKAGEDPDAIYQVALWARDQKMLPEARDLLRKVIELKPSHENAALNLKLVELELAKTTGTGPRPISTTQGTGPVEPVRIDPSQLLTIDDIHRIRLVELASPDRVAVEFRNDVLTRFMKKMEGQDMFAERDGDRRFLRMTRVEQVMYILKNTELGNTGIRDDILIKSDPEVMKVFRQRIWPMVRNTCASVQCHGGAKGAGSLRLFDLPMTDDRVAYTNFFILQGWQKKGKRVVDRDAPISSMLLQAGLPSNIAEPGLGHPGKALPNPPFPSQKHPAYVMTDKWIQSLSRSLRMLPGYGIRYKIPGMPEPQPPTTTAPVP
ncbi:MAG TPA: hypothetical protein VM389_07000 [Phycisphaerae bacterium]|nr:hypothetical protein [Phycisphaerae bacterium]HUU22268.1 hypothetical protein [Phycisphaerae bacterium]